MDLRAIKLLLLLAFSISILICCDNKGLAVKLVKCEEITIEFPNYKNKIASGVYSNFLPPRFVIKENEFLVLMAPYYSYYWINLKTGEYVKICDFGLGPGETAYFPESLTFSDNNEIVVSDVVRRVNIFNEKGILKESILLPSVLNNDTYGNIWMCNKYSNYLIKSDNEVCVLDLKTGEICNLIELSCIDNENIKTKTIGGKNMSALLCDVTSNGHVLIVKPFEPYIYEYSMDGKLVHKYDKIPSHYISYLDIPPYEEGQNRGEWLKKWSFSGFPCVFNKKYFIVARRVSAPVYLDFYSIHKQRYVGSCKIDNKAFLYADDDYIYLHNPSDKKEFIIEKYEVTFGKKNRNIRRDEIGKKVFVIKDKENVVLHKKPNSYIYKEEYKNVEPLVSIKDFKVKGLDKEEYNLLNYLNKEKKHHFVILLRPMCDCYFPRIKETIHEYCGSNKEFDCYYIVNHPYKDELENSAIFYQYDDGKTIFNIEPERMLPFYQGSYSKWYPETIVLLIDNSGNILWNFGYDLSEFSEKISTILHK